ECGGPLRFATSLALPLRREAHTGVRCSRRGQHTSGRATPRVARGSGEVSHRSRIQRDAPPVTRGLGSMRRGRVASPGQGRCVMADDGIFVGFGTPTRGREDGATKVFMEFAQYLGAE